MAITLYPGQSYCQCFIVRGKDLVLRRDGLPLTFEDLERVQDYFHRHAHSFSGPWSFEEKSTDICVLRLEDVGDGEPGGDVLPPGYERQTLRSFYARHGEEVAMSAFRAKALAEWLYSTRFCPRCGASLHPDERETALHCPDCGNTVYPRINPCVIMLVSRGEEILLALHRNRNMNFYSCLAGFIEAGESVENAVRREIMEETGITVRNIRYYGSQSWPFPSQLMLGFTAEYESGEIHVQEDELQTAAWFPRNDCPATPPPGSMAYRLIHGE